MCVYLFDFLVQIINSFALTTTTTLLSNNNTIFFISHREEVKPTHYLFKGICKTWDPIINWLETQYKMKVNVHGPDDDFSSGAVQETAREVFSSQVLPELKKDIYLLVTFHAMTEILGSVFTAWALFKGFLNTSKAIYAVQMPVIEQSKAFGLVQGEHDVSFAEQKCKLASCVLFLQLAIHRHNMP